MPDETRPNPFAKLAGLFPAERAARPEDQAAKPPLRPGLTKPAAAAVKERVTVRRERAGRAGKTVTLAEGPGLKGLDLDALAREAARALGTGARVEERSIVVQGDQADRLVEWLRGRGFESVARGN